MSTPQVAPALIVPMEMFALPVGTAGLAVADIAHSFDPERRKLAVWLGQNTEPGIFTKSAESLQPGVHLHWSLPRALTHGSVTFSVAATVWATLAAQGWPEPLCTALSQLPALAPTVSFANRSALEAALRSALAAIVAAGSAEPPDADGVEALTRQISGLVAGRTSYPPVPNRWRVTRHAPDLPGAVDQSWIVESDHLRTEQVPAADPYPKQHALSPSVLQLPGDLNRLQPPLHRFLGRVLAAEGPPAPAPHAPHTAVGYGLPTFAAALPNCYNVFGFYDPLDHLPVDAAAAHRLSYSVVGWYADPTSDDPIASRLASGTAGEWIAQAAWGWEADVNRPAPASTLLSGLLRDVPWPPPAAAEPVRSAPQVAIGNSSAEALSALLAGQAAMRDRPGAERYFNALQFGLLAQLDAGQLPGVLKAWDEAMHRYDFAPLPGGTLWVLRDHADAGPAAAAGLAGATSAAGATGAAAAPAQAVEPAEQPMPEDLAALLNTLNTAQADCDRRERDLAARRSQLFADWCNYLLIFGTPPGITPGSDDLVATDALLDQAEDRLAEAVLTLGTDTQDHVAARTLRDQGHRQLSDALRLRRADPAGGPHYQLQASSAPRFWQPNEPVVVLSGDAASPAPSSLPTHRPAPGAPPVLSCKLSATGDPIRAAMLERLGAEARSLAGAPPAAAAAAVAAPWPQRWAPPWRPLLMQWEIAYHAAERLDTPGSALAPDDLIAHHAGFDAGNPNELAFAPFAPNAEADVYQGTVVLAGNAELNIREQARRYLDTHPAAPDDADRTQLAGELAVLRDMPAMPLLGQVLSGFNAALLGRRQCLQLPVINPNARTGEDAGFARQIREATIGANQAATLPKVRLNPLRSGHLVLRRLWLVDAFGQVAVVVGDGDASHGWVNPEPERPIVRAASFVAAADGDAIALRPRLVQPARLGFRWRSAVDDQQQMNSHPASSPVIGWLVANHLDDSLALFDAAGEAWGSLNLHGPVWQGAPGPSLTQAPEQRAGNPHLRGFVSAMRAATQRDPAHLRAFLDAIEAMCDHVLPHNLAQRVDLSVLMGRPLALVRASLELELFGPPALAQGPLEFRHWLASGERADRGIATLKFPVCLGHKGDLNDGLIGYFIDQHSTDDTYAKFYVEAFDGPDGHGVCAPGFDQLSVCAGAPQRLVTMLIDPRAPVHAATGILPVKKIEIPAAMIDTAVGRLTVGFPISSVLAPRAAPGGESTAAGIGLPLPDEPGYRWSFVHVGADATGGPPGWRELPISAVTRPADFAPHPQQLLDGWLRLQPTSSRTDP